MLNTAGTRQQRTWRGYCGYLVRGNMKPEYGPNFPTVTLVQWTGTLYDLADFETSRRLAWSQSRRLARTALRTFSRQPGGRLGLGDGRGRG